MDGFDHRVAGEDQRAGGDVELRGIVREPRRCGVRRDGAQGGEEGELVGHVDGVEKLAGYRNSRQRHNGLPIADSGMWLRVNCLFPLKALDVKSDLLIAGLINGSLDRHLF